MTVYNVDRKKLIEKITENRAEHRGIYEKALDVYRQRVIEAFEQRLARAKKGKKVDMYVRLPQPEDHTDQYDNALAALEWDIRNVIEISAGDFNKWVLNKWEWDASFAANTSSYLVD